MTYEEKNPICLISRFAMRHGLKTSVDCDDCKGIHKAVRHELRQGYAVVYFEECPLNPPNHTGPIQMTPVDPQERQEWMELLR